MNLGLHNKDAAAQVPGNRNRLIRGVGHAAFGNRHPETGKQLLGLILVYVHRDPATEVSVEGLDRLRTVGAAPIRRNRAPVTGRP